MAMCHGKMHARRRRFTIGIGIGGRVQPGLDRAQSRAAGSVEAGPRHVGQARGSVASQRHPGIGRWRFLESPSD